MSAIDDKYRQIIGANPWLGQPATPERPCPDGIGRYRHYQNGGSIYWSPGTGAHLIFGLIRVKWERLGWERSPHGYPTTDESNAGSGRGRYNNFTNGTIIWRRGDPAAYSVYGAIYGKWGQVGYDGGYLGFPQTDETGTPDGVGRYNHFEGGSIYWTPATGPQIVIGAIRDTWAREGWERSPLGYPISDEQVTPETGGQGRHSRFQGGTIFWTPTTGTRIERNGQGRKITGWVDWLRCHSETPGFGIAEADEPFAVVSVLDFGARNGAGVVPTRTVLYGPLAGVDNKENHTFPFSAFYEGPMSEPPTFIVGLLEHDNVSADVTRSAAAAAVQAAALATTGAPRARVVEEAVSAFSAAVEPVSGPAIVNRLIGRPVAITANSEQAARAARGEKVALTHRFSGYGDYSLHLAIQAR